MYIQACESPHSTTVGRLRLNVLKWQAVGSPDVCAGPKQSAGIEGLSSSSGGSARAAVAVAEGHQQAREEGERRHERRPRGAGAVVGPSHREHA